MSYVRVSILGSMTGGEVWSINPTFDPTGEFGTTVNQTQLDAASQAIANLSPGSDLLAILSTSAAVTGARVEVRNDVGDGLLATSTAMRISPLSGTGTATKPSQTAMVFSLRTDTPGASGRGRIYWPACNAAMLTTFRALDTQVTNVMNNMKTYLTAMESALVTAFPLIGFDLAVRSKTTGTTPHVNRMRVGDVLDTQRRRRDNLPEAYQQVAI
jgi:hypothetical protein